MNMGIVKCMLLAANGMTDFCKVGSRHLTRTSMEAVKKKSTENVFYFIYLSDSLCLLHFRYPGQAPVNEGSQSSPTS